jgi:tRNA pseudouridine38-40 synthase
MTHWKLILAYDGTPFHGWQIQPGLPTIQGTLADAIHRTVGESVLPQGSGRTDAGVHALGQVASFSLAAAIPPDRLQSALNRCLPPSIRILSAELVASGFHARHSALHKTYEYRIFPLRPAPSKDAVILSEARRAQRRARSKDPEELRITATDRPLLPAESIDESDRICPPTLAPFVWPCPWPLDLSALNQAARHVLRTHDFTSFAASDPDLTTRGERATEPGAPHLESEMWDGPPQNAVIPTEGGALAAVADGPPHFASASMASAKTNIRTIFHSCWHAHDGLLIYRVTANGFLHHMVRNLVGTFVQAGAHRLDPDSIPDLLAARNRSVTGPTAPATGLFLVSVEYPSLSGDPSISTAAEPLTTEN